MTEVGLYYYSCLKEGEGNYHHALQHMELWCCFCIVSASMLSCWLNHWVGHALIELFIVVGVWVCFFFFFSLQLKVRQNSTPNFKNSEVTKNGAHWGLNWQQSQKLPVCVCIWEDWHFSSSRHCKCPRSSALQSPCIKMKETSNLWGML